jgi:hypothetical protein
MFHQRRFGLRSFCKSCKLHVQPNGTTPRPHRPCATSHPPRRKRSLTAQARVRPPFDTLMYTSRAVAVPRPLVHVTAASSLSGSEFSSAEMMLDDLSRTDKQRDDHLVLPSRGANKVKHVHAGEAIISLPLRTRGEISAQRIRRLNNVSCLARPRLHRPQKSRSPSSRISQHPSPPGRGYARRNVLVVSHATREACGEGCDPHPHNNQSRVV